MKRDPKKISGLTLIDKILEFISMTPNSVDWNFEKLNNFPSKLIRLKQINVLLNIFIPENIYLDDLKTNIENVVNGTFIKSRNIKLYETVFKQMDNEIITKLEYRPEKIREWSNYDLLRNYSEIIRYKQILNELLDFNNGILEISYPYFYSVIMTTDTSKKLNSKNIDNFLNLVIDPSNRIFSKTKLTKEYNYPKKDVYDIDFEDF